MLIVEKMKETAFSPTERKLVNYLLEDRQNLKHKTARQIAQETYTNPSMLIRIAKKLGFDGWTELKDAYLEEVRYLDCHFENIDSNLPFSEDDNCMTIAGKLARLHQSTISDSLSLFRYESLQKAIQMINQAANIKLFTKNENQLIVQDFVFRMNRMQKYTTMCSVDSEHIFEAYTCNPDTCAILISYTGDSQWSSNTIRILKKRDIPVIALTGIGHSSLSELADCVLHITTRERLYSKIASFTTTVSINYLLDVLYSCVFAEDYQVNLKRKIQISRLTDTRKTTASIMEELDWSQD